MSQSVLVISADPGVRHQVEAACAELGADCVHADSLDDAAEFIARRRPDLVLLNVGEARAERFDVFDQFRSRWPRLCVVLLSGGSDGEQAIEAMKRGALDHLAKPLRRELLVASIRNSLRISHDMHVPTVFEKPEVQAPVEQIIGSSPAMQEVYKRIGLIAPREVNVLITGESGTGKELIARAVYHHSQRRDKPFLAVHCAAIPDTLLESELFGHEKGAFTGADRKRLGKFEQCHGGTLFLDEVGDIPLATQAKLLRVLQDHSFQRLGGSEIVHTDVRIIAATHQVLEQLIAQARFREDLYYRLKVATIHVPPLREREVDVALLAHYFVKQLNPKLGTSVRRFSPETLALLLRYRWPGNVRELEHAAKAALVVARGSVLLPEFLPEAIRRTAEAPADAPVAEVTGARPEPASLTGLVEALAADERTEGRLHEVAVEALERELLRVCLERNEGRLSPTARVLGITRATLRKKMARLGIQVSTQVKAKQAEI